MTLTTITTHDELVAFLAEREAVEPGETFVRWSNGPERDAANNWTSRNYFDADNPEDLDGLSATPVLDIENPVADITRWQHEVWGETCYLLTGSVYGYCSDDEPLLYHCQPLAIIAPTALVG